MQVGDRSDIYSACLPRTRQVVIADVGGKDSSYEDLLAVMPSSDCRYAGQCCSIVVVVHKKCCQQGSLMSIPQTCYTDRSVPYMQCMTTSLRTAKGASSTSWFSLTGMWWWFPGPVFKRSLQQNQCRIQKSRSVFCCPCRAPDAARIKAKMMYASTKDFFKGFLDGLSVELQGSDLADITEQDVAEAVRSTVTRQ